MKELRIIERKAYYETVGQGTEAQQDFILL